MQALKRNIDLILILVIGFALRFSVSITHSYTNDELSAINRLRYDSFADLIESGVKKGDMHPAGVQVFEKFWSSLFGTSEMALRLPFVLFGTASIFLIFLLGKTWFNRRTGIYAAAILSILYFPIIQSELARPYSPGLFITLLTVWFYYKVLFSDAPIKNLTTELSEKVQRLTEKNRKYKDAVLLGLCFAAGMYTHYFLFLFLLFIGFTGLFFLKKETVKFYLLAVALAVLLFIPHISTTLYHLSVGGLGWLGKPDNDFIFQFTYHAFNESWIFLILVFGLILFSLFQKNRNDSFQSKYYWLIAVWFFGIYVIAHILSVFSTPLLKFPVMLFAFPFLVLMMAYLISAIRFEKMTLLLLLGIGFYTTFFRGLYDHRHMGYRETAKHLVEWNEQYGDENIYTVYNLSNPDYMNFYATQFGDSVQFDRSVIEFSDDVLIRRDLMEREENFCVVGYSERLTLPQVFETVKEFYPYVVAYDQFDNSAVFLMSKQKTGPFEYEQRMEKKLLTELDLYDYSTKGWTLDPNAIVDTLGVRYYYQLDQTNVYGPDFVFQKSAADKIIHSYLKIEVGADCPKDAQLTVTITGTRNGEPIQHHGEIFWIGHDLEEMLISTKDSVSGAGTAYFAFEIPDFIKETDELKISLWNRNGKSIRLSSFTVSLVQNIWN